LRWRLLGRGVDEDQETLRSLKVGARFIAILGADIDGRRARQPVALEDVVELSRIVI